MGKTTKQNHSKQSQKQEKEKIYISIVENPVYEKGATCVNFHATENLIPSPQEAEITGSRKLGVAPTAPSTYAHNSRLFSTFLTVIASLLFVFPTISFPVLLLLSYHVFLVASCSISRYYFSFFSKRLMEVWYLQYGVW